LSGKKAVFARMGQFVGTSEYRPMGFGCVDGVGDDNGRFHYSALNDSHMEEDIVR
jgi:hypothetical protein